MKTRDPAGDSLPVKRPNRLFRRSGLAAAFRFFERIPTNILT